MGRRFVYGPKARTPTYQPTAAPQGESRKERVKKIFFKDGKQAAIAYGVKLGLKADTVRTWIGRWRKPNGPAPAKPKPRRPSLDGSLSWQAVALFGGLGEIDEETWSWMQDSLDHLEGMESSHGKAGARKDALVLIVSSAHYLMKTCGSRRTFEAMQRLTDELVDGSGVLTPG